MVRRTNAEWLSALRSDDEQSRALADLRTYLVRAARFTLQRARHDSGRPGWEALNQLAEECAQESTIAILQRLDTFRGRSLFTTWAYAFAVKTALAAARRERWSTLRLDALRDPDEAPCAVPGDADGAPDPERHALQAEAIAALREGIERCLSPRQQQLLRAVVIEEVPTDVIVRQRGSSRNALYKALHDARRTLKEHLQSRGFDVGEMMDLYAATSPRGRR